MNVREQARADVARPGKFEGEHPMVPILWDVFLMGGADEDDGELVRIGRWTLRENDQGFVIGARHPTVADAEAVMSRDG